MKKLRLLFGTLLQLALITSAQAQYTYVTNNGTITITEYGGPGGAVEIPDRINGLPVTGIGDWAFSYFYVSGITSVTIPNSVINIGSHAFYYADLTGVILGTNVTSIGDLAFAYCSSLTNVTIPPHVTAIDGSAFSHCASLTAITVDTRNLLFSSLDGVLFDKNQTTLIQFPGGKAGGCIIPSSTTNVFAYAFQNCALLTSVTIPQSVHVIGAYTFQFCGSLTNVIMIGGVTSVGDFAFDRCTNLSSVVLGTNLASIGFVSFRSCTSLGSITIPSGVTNIAGYAFFKCGLTNVLIPDTVSQIDAYAFASCVSLIGIAVDSNNAVYSSTNGVLFDKQQARLIQFPSGKAGHYVIPDSVTTIGASAFTGWSPLSAVTIPASVTNIENGAFAYCIYLTNATFLCKISSISDSTFFLCERLTTITIPDSVTAIGSWAFAESGLRNFTIPNAVTNIGAYAFYQCLDLAGLYFQGGAPGIDSATFSGDAKATVYYLPGTAGWGSIFGGLPTALWNPQIQTSDQTFGIHNNRFGFTVVGTTNIPVVIEASTDLVIRTWIPLQSSTLTNGSIYFADLDWTNYPYRFYRLRSP